MTTSPTTSPREPQENEKIPKTVLQYMRTRNQRRLYSLLMEVFKNSGITKAELARRMGKRNQDVISRWFAGPSNLRADTVSDLLFAMGGAEADYSERYPFKEAPLNSLAHDWIEGALDTDTKKPVISSSPEVRTPTPTQSEGSTAIVRTRLDQTPA